MTSRAEQAVLALATASAVAAYLRAHVVSEASGVLIAVAVGVIAAAPAIVVQWTRVPARLVRPLRLGRLLLLVAGALLTVMSRQLPALPEDVALRWAMVVGAMLSSLALLFLYAEPTFGVAKGLLPVVAGTLSVAALNERAREFLVLASVSGIALWLHAVLTGGPRRRGRALALFALGGVALAVGTVLFLPWAEPQVTRFVAQAYSDGRTGLSDSSELGEVERLALSRRVVARVWTSEPQRLRMQVFDHFDGHRWSVGRSPQRSVEALPAEQLSGLGPLLKSVPGRTFRVVPTDSAAGNVETRVVPVLAFDDGWGLLVPASSVVLRVPGTALTVDGLGRVFVPSGFPLVYGVAGPGRGPALGRSEPSPADLQLPSPFNPGARLLAERLSARGGADDERLARTIALLQSRPYRYTLEIGAFETGDPVAEFLLRKKAGYCEYFASAAVLLLRAQGIPARYVKGVTVRAESFVGGHYVVRESDAHAWVEAYLPGTGWVEADPTPPGDYAAVHAGKPPGPIEERWESLRARVAAAWATLRQGGWAHLGTWMAETVGELWTVVQGHPLVASAVLLLLLVASGGGRACVRLVRLWLSHGRQAAGSGPHPPHVPSELMALLREVERHWTRRGHPRPSARGLREHLDAMPLGALGAQARTVSARVIDSYYRASFGHVSPTALELRTISEQVAGMD